MTKQKNRSKRLRKLSTALDAAGRSALAALNDAEDAGNAAEERVNRRAGRVNTDLQRSFPALGTDRR